LETKARNGTDPNLSKTEDPRIKLEESCWVEKQQRCSCFGFHNQVVKISKKQNMDTVFSEYQVENKDAFEKLFTLEDLFVDGSKKRNNTVL